LGSAALPGTAFAQRSENPPGEVVLRYLEYSGPDGSALMGGEPVAGDTAEAYGFDDPLEWDRVSLLDALVRLNGSPVTNPDLQGMDQRLAFDEGGGIVLLFGSSTVTVLRCIVNGEEQTDLARELKNDDSVLFLAEAPLSAKADAVAAWVKGNMVLAEADRDDTAALFALARGGYLDDETAEDLTVFDALIAEAAEIVASSDGVYDAADPDDPDSPALYAKMVLALSAIGTPRQELEDVGLLAPFADQEWICSGGTEEAAWALLALDGPRLKTVTDAYRYDPPLLAEGAGGTQTTREGLVLWLLDRQLRGGGWSLDEDAEEPDVILTAIVLQALAPYYYGDFWDVISEECWDRVLYAVYDAELALQQLQDPYSGSFGSTSADSQMVIAVCALQEDPLAFSDSEASMLDALLDNYLSLDDDHAAFKRSRRDRNAELTSTVWGLHALLAYNRLLSEKCALYDLSDVGANDKLRRSASKGSGSGSEGTGGGSQAGAGASAGGIGTGGLGSENMTGSVGSGRIGSPAGPNARPPASVAPNGSSASGNADDAAPVVAAPAADLASSENSAISESAASANPEVPGAEEFPWVALLCGLTAMAVAAAIVALLRSGVIERYAESR